MKLLSSVNCRKIQRLLIGGWGGFRLPRGFLAQKIIITFALQEP